MANEKLTQEKAYRIMLKGYPDVLDIKQMCKILGISLKTGYGLIQENKIECLKVGRAYKIPKPFLLSYLRIGPSRDSEEK
ncbi:helix-turn-helix domain-containing protein [Dehalobacter restrictus]|uniref:DNA-binding protein n=1 Tax=Dehalobacter restrictus (strain DSM 9455 / PER-K23) TaxID=871738 RepID=A0ABM5P2C6_DEHRP|nr:helix-turn-helix domain-containing protein [Dehalobacter restrictus]AHF08724.1 DNA-binding protein [Dehalobacter restrictus DSM 9455]